MTDWKLKLAAWLHDPAEKSLILMRTREGHECGTARRLREEMGIDYDSFDKRADWLAAAADRPQWPRPLDERFSSWANVRFAERMSGKLLKFEFWQRRFSTQNVIGFWAISLRMKGEPSYEETLSNRRAESHSEIPLPSDQ